MTAQINWIETNVLRSPLTIISWC